MESGLCLTSPESFYKKYKDRKLVSNWRCQQIKILSDLQRVKIKGEVMKDGVLKRLFELHA